MNEFEKPLVEAEKTEDVSVSPVYTKIGFGKKEIWLTVIFSVLFILSGIVTYAWTLANHETALPLFKKVSTAVINNVSGETNELDNISEGKISDSSWSTLFHLCVGIFFNNFKVVLAVLVGATITVYFYPVVALISNGGILGLTLGAFEIMDPKSSAIKSIFTDMLPHGIFEIPAIILACVFGARHGKSAYRALFKKQQDVPYKVVFKQTIRSFFYVLLPLLIVAALVETFITPHLMG